MSESDGVDPGGYSERGEPVGERRLIWGRQRRTNDKQDAKNKLPDIHLMMDSCAAAELW